MTSAHACNGARHSDWSVYFGNEVFSQIRTSILARSSVERSPAALCGH
ncbi:hypothetical protein [Klebsiella grimontii]